MAFDIKLTEQQKESLLDLFDGVNSVKDIVEASGYSRSFMYHFMRQFDLLDYSKKRDEVRAIEAIRLRKQGYKWSEVADLVGYQSENVAKVAVQRLSERQAENLQQVKQQKQQERDQRKKEREVFEHSIIAFFDGKRTLSEIARDSGCSKATLRVIAEKHGLSRFFFNQKADLGKKAYQLSQDGHDWDTVAQMLGYKNKWNAKYAALRHDPKAPIKKEEKFNKNIKIN